MELKMMWISVPNSCKKDYYVKYKKVASDYSFYLTNFVNIWEKKLTTDELLDLMRNNNPLLEVDSSQLISKCLEKLFDCLSHNNAETLIQSQEGNSDVALNFKIVDRNFPFKIKLEFTISSPVIFYEEITIPLVQMIIELKHSESSLIESLKKKDAEIQDYKAEGASITLKHLETKEFNEYEHQQMFATTNNAHFNYEDIFSIVNTKNMEESTPKHLEAHKSDADIPTIKKETKETSPIKNCVSSPMFHKGIAPICMRNDDDDNEEPDESNLRLGKRKKIKKQLNL